MKHTIRRYGQLEEIDCEYGSDVFDKNGREIFEGDIVQLVGDNEHRAPVTYRDACFWIDEMPLGNFADGDLIVVGHIKEGAT